MFYGHKVSGGRSQWKGDYVDGEASPLYPFGHGLGYTTFRISDLAVTPDRADWNGEVTVTAVSSTPGTGKATRSSSYMCGIQWRA